MHRIDLVGKKFGSWTVLRRLCGNRNDNLYWECQCDCGTLKKVYGGHLRRGKSKSCGCQICRGHTHIQWTGIGGISGNHWDSIKRSASGAKGNRVPIELSITMEDAWNQCLKQEGKCALTGLTLVFNYGRKTGLEHTASLDRIDSSKGYTIDNIQWVHKVINFMKRTYDQDYFIEMCKLVANHNA